MDELNNKPGGFGGRGPKKTIDDFHGYFEKVINKEVKKVADLNAAAVAEGDAASIVTAKESNALNGLETSTFTVVARIRPVLPFDSVGVEGEEGGDASLTPYACVIPGPAGLKKAEGAKDSDETKEWTEECYVMTPRMTVIGKPKVDKQEFNFDHVFGPEVEGPEIMQKVGMPLVAKALLGQVGVVFAYGQTGSGKTHTMNNLLASISSQLFADQQDTISVSFSYLEILGQQVTDCLYNNGAASDAAGDTLPPPSSGEGEEEEPSLPAPGSGGSSLEPGQVKIGEMLDGSVKTLGLSETPCTSADELKSQMAAAQARRATAATERNATSSRSHGVAILRVTHNRHSAGSVSGVSPAPGVLYIIDLAGSERLADSKGHSDARMEETKAINLSLMSLKECIRARTMAGAGDGRSEVHVPYRRSKLTLLMKDVFDIGCARLCATVVLAHVSPLARDAKHSVNTISYAAPLRVAVRAKPTSTYERDVADPALWTFDQCTEWMKGIAPAVDPTWLLSAASPDTAGIELCRTPEPVFFERIKANGGAMEDSKALYSKLWTLICDAKTRRRRPNGTIITEEQEVAARLAEDAAREEKARIWAEREKHLRTER
jgi:kinesin family protein 2/24